MFRVHKLIVLAASVAVSGCATVPAEENNPDPWESMNRGIYAFNDTIDRYTLKPVAKGYRAVMPGFARTGVSNFFFNLSTPRSSLNNFLQGKPGRGFSELGRFAVNSTIGIGGLFDVASRMDIPTHEEDFAQTFAVWGIPSGPYFYVPFLGPSTVTDAIAIPIDRMAHPLFYYENTSVRDKLTILQIIDIRTGVLAAEEFITDSKDPYLSIREAYLQNRTYRIYDGDPPVSEEEDDLFEEFLDEDY